MPTDSGALALVLLATGTVTVIVSAFWALRRVVHFLDYIEHVAEEGLQAVKAINHHLTQNGGRIEAPLSQERAKTATLMDLLYDMRVLLHQIGERERAHDKAAEARVDRIIEGVKLHHG